MMIQSDTIESGNKFSLWKLPRSAGAGLMSSGVYCRNCYQFRPLFMS